MVLFINESGVSYQVINGLNGITGSAFLSLLFIVIILFLIAILFRIPIEFTAIFILPLVLTFAAFYGEFVAVTGVLLIYLGVLLGKHFFFNT